MKRANYLLFDAQKEWFDFKQLSSPTEEQKASVDKMFNTKYDYPRNSNVSINEHYQKILKMLQDYTREVEKYLRNVSTRDRLVKDICRVITRDWIEFDANENLLGFLNKVYDLKKGD